MIDKLGQPLEAGDYILYARTLGRSADLGIGRILNVDETHTAPTFGRRVRVPDSVLGTKAGKIGRAHV